MDDNYTNMDSLIQLKKVIKAEEFYNRSTVVNLMEKMKEELLVMRKEIPNQEHNIRILSKKLEKKRIKVNGMKEKVNQVYSKI